MSQTAASPNGTPAHLDHNKSIIWARYLIDSPEWLALATRVSRESTGGAPATTGAASAISSAATSGPIKLLSLSLLTPSGKVVYEAMVKPQEQVSANLMAEHGLDYSVIYNAQPFSEIVAKLRQLIGSKQILTWDLAAQQAIFDQMCSQSGVPIIPFAGYSLRPEYARFVGELDAKTGSYKTQPLNVKGINATAECRAFLNTITTMASTSQIRDTAPTGHPNWTAELYKPKVNAKEKIKDFLGL